ncbi:hypothetical protein Tco_0007277 [Tanacetum coccineum]
MKRMGHDIVQDSIWEHDDDSEEDQEEDGDDGDTFDMWDIMILNVTMVDDEDDFNPTKDLEELERLLAKEPKSNFTEIQGYNSKETKFEVTSTRNYVIYRRMVEIWWMLLEEANLEHGLEHVVSSSFRANPRE